MLSRFLIAALLLSPAPALSQGVCDRPLSPWLLAGPFPVDSGAARLDATQVGDPSTLRPRAGDREGTTSWRLAEGDSLGRIDFATVFAEPTLDRRAAWAVAYLAAATPREVRLAVESDDDVVVWLNGSRLLRREVARGVGSGADTVTLALRAGTNTLVYKVVNRGGGFGLGGRLLSASDGAIGDLLATVNPELAPPRAGATTVVLGPATVGSRLVLDTAGQLTVPVTVCAMRSADVRGGRLETGELSMALDALAPGTVGPLAYRAAWDALAEDAVESRALVAAMARRPDGQLATLASLALPVTPATLLSPLSRPIVVEGWRLTKGAAGAPVDASWRPVPSAADSIGRRAATAIGIATRVPPALAGLTLELAAAEFGAGAQYRVNGQAVRPDSLGVVTLCAPCAAGAPLEVVIEPRGAPWWDVPALRVRELGWREIREGAEWARRLTGDSTLAMPGDSTARAMLAAALAPDKRAYRDTIAAWLARLAPIAARLRRDTIDVVGNSHIDAAWLWRWPETVDVVNATWGTATKLMARYPDMHFAASSAQYYVWLERERPEVLRRLQALAREGRWHPVGGWWVEPDENMPSGESLVRQGLYGQRTFMRLFGRPATVAWTPDTFGYPWTLPQIFRRSGFDFFVTQKLRWNDRNRWPAARNAFWWEGPDGTRLFTYIPYGYDHDLDGRRLASEWRRTVDSSASRRMLVLYGVGDHGGGPTMEMLDRARELQRIPTFPVVRDADPARSLATMRTDAPSSPTIRDELYLEYHRGVLTTQAAMKRSNRRMENLLAAAEAAATVAPGAYPRDTLRTAWELTLFNQFHDILPGSGIADVYRDAAVDYGRADSLARGVLERAIVAIGATLDTRPRVAGDVPYVVFNPSPRPRTEVVRLRAPDATAARDAAGRSLPVVKDGPVLEVLVRDVPATGATVVFVGSGAALAVPSPAVTLPRNVLENRWLRVEVDTLTGGIARMYDKARRREVLARGPATGGLVLIEDRPRDWDAWNIDHLNGARAWVDQGVSVQPAIRGAMGHLVAVTRSRDSTRIRQFYGLRSDVARLDITTIVEWRESRRLLKVALPFAFHPDSTVAEIPYGVIARPTIPRDGRDSARFETAMQRFVDVSARGYGVAVANDSKYGYSASGDTLFLTLLRSPKWPDPQADMGTHVFTYSLAPHAGDWRAPEVRAAATSLNAPLRAARVGAHAGIARSTSFLTLVSGTADVGALKRGEDDDGWIVRLVETAGSPTTATLRFPFPVIAEDTDMLERGTGTMLRSRGNLLPVRLGRFEIRTIRVRRIGSGD